nr:MAG TPA: Cerato-platanin-like protein [Caudoviricetes sp.]
MCRCCLTCWSLRLRVTSVESNKCILYGKANNATP